MTVVANKQAVNGQTFIKYSFLKPRLLHGYMQVAVVACLGVTEQRKRVKTVGGRGDREAAVGDDAGGSSVKLRRWGGPTE